MRRNIKLIFGILILASLISLTFCSRDSTAAVIGFTFSDSIIPEAEFTWDIVKLKRTFEDSIEIKDGELISQGDTIKLVISTDPDDLTLTNYTDIFTTDVNWATAYLNSKSLGTNMSDLLLNLAENEYFDALDFLILPVNLTLDTGTENTFDYLYDVFEPNQFDDGDSYFEVSKSDDYFTIGWRHYHRIPVIGVKITVEFEAESIYNMHTGILEKLTVDFKDAALVYQLTLLNSESTLKAEIGWTPYLVSLVVLPLLIIYRRRKKK